MDLSLLWTKPIASSLTLGCTLWVSYLVGLAVYRLYLSPIAKFPGPKLAALTGWYECYYDVFLNGKFIFHIQDLHKIYGPIIRINPHEIHISDSDFFDQLYARSGRLDKYEWMAGRLGNEGSFLTTASHRLHRLRRAPLNPYFSKGKILEFQPVIREKLRRLCYRISQYAETGREINLRRAWTAFVGDALTEYTFAKSYDHLESPDFKTTFHEPLHEACTAGSTLLQFPWIWPLLNSLPDWVVGKVNPPLYMLINVQRDFERQIRSIQEGDNERYKDVEHPTIFHELLQSDLPPHEKTLHRLVMEAQTMIGAAILTTGWSLTVASFHIINTPEILRNLRAELVSNIPDPNAELDWLQLERLPYLSACIREAIRLSYAVTARMPRLSDSPVQYKEWTIPPRIPVSMTIVDINHDEEIYPDSHSFVPERWLNNPPPEKYVTGFSRGTRSCLGQNLAMAELYLGLATVFRRFTLSLYETDKSDVVLAHDHFIPMVKLDSKGVRVKVVSIDT